MTASQITQRPEGYQVEDHQPDQERLVIPPLFDGARLSSPLRVKEHPVEIALDNCTVRSDLLHLQQTIPVPSEEQVVAGVAFLHLTRTSPAITPTSTKIL